MGSSSNHQNIYTLPFWLLCLSSLLFFSSFNMILPELPGYLEQLGGKDFKGLIIALFTLTAMISRPFSGKLADRIGRVPVIMAGSVVCLVCSLFYPLLTSLSGFFLLRLVHGFSTGFTPTGQTAYLADIVPPERRGEAMGYLGTAGTLGMASGPALGGWIAQIFSLDIMFYCSSFCALLSIVILFRLRETATDHTRFTFWHLAIEKSDLFEPRVLAPCLVMALCAFSYGAVYTVIPDYGKYLNFENTGVLFMYFTFASLLVRLIAGRASDKYGRVTILRISTALALISMLVVGTASTKIHLILGIVLYGLAQGSTSPTLLAWATDLSDPQRKGRGVASLYIFMEFGIGIGALVSGWLFGNDITRLFLVFAICSSLCLAAFAFLIRSRKQKLQQV
jgi:MFS family permease